MLRLKSNTAIARVDVVECDFLGMWDSVKWLFSDLLRELDITFPFCRDLFD